MQGKSSFHLSSSYQGSKEPNNDLVDIHVFHDPITLLCDPYGDLWSIFVNLGCNENPISQCLCDLSVIFLVSTNLVSTNPDRWAWDIRREGDKLRYGLRSLTRPSDVG